MLPAYALGGELISRGHRVALVSDDRGLKIPGAPAEITSICPGLREHGGVHFTGTPGVFNSMWKTIGANMSQYLSYPRIVGETGGKDFIIAHPSANPQAVAVAIARGRFEYQGQKCSAASRVYVPRSLWKQVRDATVGMMDEIKQGDVRDFRNFVSAVIDKKSFDKISEYLDDARKNATIIAGGTADASEGFFIKPTLIDRIQDRYGNTIFQHEARGCAACVTADWTNPNEPALLDTRRTTLRWSVSWRGVEP